MAQQVNIERLLSKEAPFLPSNAEKKNTVVNDVKGIIINKINRVRSIVRILNFRNNLTSREDCANYYARIA